MADFIINNDDNVYIPAEDSYLLAENLLIKEGQSVLEIGTGSGIVAMYASRLTDAITVTDINFDACELARKNFEANSIEGIEILFGNMFEPVKNRKFDVILFNTPYLPTEEGEVIEDNLNYAFDGGLNGRKVIDLFLRYSFSSSSSIRFIFSFISFLSRLQITCLESISAFLIFLFLCWNSAFVKLE